MPENPINPALFSIFALSTLLLSLKALFLGMATAVTRGRLKQFLNAEDAEWLGGVHLASDSEQAARIGRAQRNDLENLLLFVVVGSLFMIAGGGLVAGSLYCGAFLIARLAHSYAYLGRRPALRRNAYTLGFLVILAMAVHAAVLLVGILPW